MSLKAFLITGLVALVLALALLFSTKSLWKTQDELVAVQASVTTLQDLNRQAQQNYADLQTRVVSLEQFKVEFRNDLADAVKKYPRNLDARAEQPVVDVLCKRLRCAPGVSDQARAVRTP